MPLSVRAVSAREPAERDRAAIQRGTPSRVLMQRAGTAAAEEISRRYPDRLQNGAIVFTGPGNNGGDGWGGAGVLARLGVEVTVVEAAEAKSPDAVAEKNAAAGVVKSVNQSLALGEFDRAQSGIDALPSPGADAG